MSTITERIHSALIGYANLVYVTSGVNHPRDVIEKHVENFRQDIIRLGDVLVMFYEWHQNGGTMLMSWITKDEPQTVAFHEYEFPHLMGDVSAPDPISDYDRAMRGI